MDFKNERLMMSKEETRKRAKELLNENQADLITKYMFLEQQCKKQKEVIDKITDIINDYLKEDYSIYTENEIEVDLIVKLKNILKEVSE